MTRDGNLNPARRGPDPLTPIRMVFHRKIPPWGREWSGIFEVGETRSPIGGGGGGGGADGVPVGDRGRGREISHYRGSGTGTLKTQLIKLRFVEDVSDETDSCDRLGTGPPIGQLAGQPFFGDIDRSSQYVKIYRIEGAALSKQVFDGGSLDLTVLPRKAFADGGSLDLTARWINFVKGKAFIVVRSSDLNRDLQLDKMNVLTVCTTGLYMDSAQPDRREQLGLCIILPKPHRIAPNRTETRKISIRAGGRPSAGGSAGVAGEIAQPAAMPRREKFPAPRASQSLRAGSSQGGNGLPQAPSASQLLCVVSSQERPSYKTVLLSSPSLDHGHCIPQAPRASQSLCAGSSQQGNCLPQAPSASQPLRVGSSPKRPSYKTVFLSSPSLDQGPRASQPLCAGSSQEGNCLPQAPSASQSLRAGSSQERPSYLTVLCSSPSLVQGNCRLQAPSVSQSLHVESSLEKRTDRSILESPSLDRVPHLLHQSSVKTVCRLGPSTPQLVLDSGIRNVMVCLRHIYSKRIYSGKLIDGISVINNTETKLIWFVKAATVEEFNNGSRRDIIDLRQLMVEAVLKPYKVRGLKSWTHSLAGAVLHGPLKTHFS
ncbi:hypothetical protein HYC85_029362 [Camellia sinensis]|uniref:Uncharacterized protein n=1 Tax=Camellia sinensis TaxID=4442 RepID=A0A7J7FZ24_CAMSI|nr:hypothetical protein HYC85_029362 [Camellia sinensis]